MNRDLEQLVQELRAEGALDSAGNFTLDACKAREKLAQRQQREAGLWLVKLIQAAHMLKNRDSRHRKVILLIAETRDKGSEGKTRQALLDLQFGNIILYSLNINRLVTSLMTRQPVGRLPADPLESYFRAKSDADNA